MENYTAGAIMPIMKNEAIVIADDSEAVVSAYRMSIEIFGEVDGHIVLGEAGSVYELKDILNKGMKPTLILLDKNFPNPDDGKKAYEYVKTKCPNAVVVVVSDEKPSYTENWWSKSSIIDGKTLVEKITNLNH